MASLKEYEHSLAAVKRQNVYKLRSALQDIWTDKGLPEMARAVMGLTGSGELLTEYDHWAIRVRDHHDEPAVRPHINKKDGELLGATGGIIRGNVHIQRQGAGPGRGRCDSFFGIPVYSLWDASAKEQYDQPRKAGGAVMLEAGQITCPGRLDEDGVESLYSAEHPTDLLIGWEELYDSEYWTSLRGLTLTLQRTPKTLNPSSNS
jgi:hypothetical protein